MTQVARTRLQAGKASQPPRKEGNVVVVFLLCVYMCEEGFLLIINCLKKAGGGCHRLGRPGRGGKSN